MNDFSDLVLTFTSEELAEHNKQIRVDVLNEFVKSMELWGNSIKEIRGTTPFFTIENIKNAAEQVKENQNE